MKRLLKVSAMSGLLTLLRMVMGFIIAKVIAVYTGPAGIAQLGQVQSMVNSLNGIINSPGGSGIVRFTAENKVNGFEACSPWWRASLRWILSILALIIPVGILFSAKIAGWVFLDTSLAWIVIITVCFLPLSAIGTLCNSVINGQQLYRRYVGLGMLSTIISSILMLLMIYFYSIKGALLVASIQSALIGVVMLCLNLRQPWFKLTFWWGETDLKAYQDIGKYMLMAITSAFTVTVSLIIVRSMIISQVGWEVAGQWQAVWKVSEALLSIITIALGTYYLPRLSELDTVISIKREIYNTVKVVLPVVTLMSIIVYFMRDFIIILLFTEEFKNARDLFFMQLVGGLIKIISWLYAYPMLSQGAMTWFISTEVFASLLFILLNYIFIPQFGIIGATYAFAMTYTIYFFVVYVNLDRIIK